LKFNWISAVTRLPLLATSSFPQYHLGSSHINITIEIEVKVCQSAPLGWMLEVGASEGLLFPDLEAMMPLFTWLVGRLQVLCGK
jgi:hypothetical protein